MCEWLRSWRYVCVLGISQTCCPLYMSKFSDLERNYRGRGWVGRGLYIRQNIQKLRDGATGNVCGTEGKLN